MIENGDTVDTTDYQPQPLIDVDPPAPDAEEQKTEETPSPAAAAEETKPEAAETPEQQEARKQSRRARARERAAAELAAAQTEARLLREQLARLNSHPQQEASGEPKREQFDDYETYLEKRAEWIADQKVEQRLKAERDERQVSERQNQAKTTQEKIAQEWEKKERDFLIKTPDYVDAVTPFVEQDIGTLSDHARQAIVEGGPQVLHYLATHADVVEKIAGLSPLRQAAEILKLEDAVKTPAPVKLSKAPEPIKPVSQGRSSPPGYSENMSDAEYREWRKAQGATWAR